MDTNAMQELLLNILPAWHYWFGRPLKQMLTEGVSLGMYYGIQALRYHGGPITMTELANFIRVPRQQMTKIVTRLVDSGFVQRIYDPTDRRIIRLKLTGEGERYVERFLTQDTAFYRQFFDSLSEEDRTDMYHALDSLHNIFEKKYQECLRSAPSYEDDNYTEERK